MHLYGDAGRDRSLFPGRGLMSVYWKRYGEKSRHLPPVFPRTVQDSPEAYGSLVHVNLASHQVPRVYLGHALGHRELASPIIQDSVVRSPHPQRLARIIAPAVRRLGGDAEHGAFITAGEGSTPEMTIVKGRQPCAPACLRIPASLVGEHGMVYNFYFFAVFQCKHPLLRQREQFGDNATTCTRGTL